MSFADRLKRFFTSAAKSMKEELRPGSAEQDWSDVVPENVAPAAAAAELPSDGWVVVETSGEPSGYGVLRRGDTLIRFHESLWKSQAGDLAVSRGAGVRVDIDGWVPGRNGQSPEPVALRIPIVDLPKNPELPMELWLECLQRQGLLVGVTAKQLVRTGVREGWLEDFWSADGSSSALMYSLVLVGLASDESRALKPHADWLRSFPFFEDEAHEDEAAELAQWLGVPTPEGSESFTEVLVACNEAAAKAQLPQRLFRLAEEGEFVAVKLTVPACAELVLNGALPVVAPTLEDDDFQWRHQTLAVLASMADETGHRELASVLFVEAMELAERAARSDAHGAWRDDVKAIAAMQARRAAG
ncbi:MAG: hypothetical protein ABTQ32_13045 [Myxococcaceae bacterium]